MRRRKCDPLFVKQNSTKFNKIQKFQKISKISKNFNRLYECKPVKIRLIYKCIMHTSNNNLVAMCVHWSFYFLHHVVVLALRDDVQLTILYGISHMHSHSYHLIIPVQMLSKTDEILANQSIDNHYGPITSSYLKHKVRMTQA